MAYEGMDVPHATHLAAVTRYRSKSWIEQMFARITRCDINGPAWDQQKAWAFVPDDTRMNEIIDLIRAEQVQALSIGGGGGGGGGADSSVAALNSEETERRASSLDGTASSDDLELVKRLRNEFDLTTDEGVLELYYTIELFKERSKQQWTPQHDSQLTMREREKRLRGAINAVIASYAWRRVKENRDFLPTAIKEVNKALFGRFKKSREHMTLTELERVWSVVSQQYGAKA
jgi:hypothetical protein